MKIEEYVLNLSCITVFANIHIYITLVVWIYYSDNYFLIIYEGEKNGEKN